MGPDPKWSAPAITSRFQGLDSRANMSERDIVSLTKKVHEIWAACDEKIDVLNMRIEELEKELYGE